MSIEKDRILRFPYLACVSSTILSGTKSDFIRFDYRGFESGRLLMKDGSNPKMERRWFLTCDARLWMLPRVGTRRSALRWLAGVYDFTLAEHRVESGLEVSTDELMRLLSPLPSDSDFPTAGRLKKFIRQRSGRVFDATLFLEFWSAHCPSLQPPNRWGEEVVLEDQKTY